jgi:protein-L-isoaspartate(D-aspartate) O-methyltransferase
MTRPSPSASVRAAFDAVPRTHFLPQGQKAFADRDAPLEIGGGATNSQPSTVAAMLDLLDVQHGHRVLDVGAGSGWTTALLAHLVGPDGRVIGVELDPELAAWGASNLAEHGGLGWATLEPARDGVLGWPDDAPYDRILVSAMARDLPDELVAQLAPSGLMVIPVSGRMARVVRQPDGELTVTHHGSYRFVPLR